MRKLALIAGDGGLQTAFVAGALDALSDVFDLQEVKVCAASSASVGSLFYYLSHGRNNPTRKIWTEELASPAFCSPRVFGAIAQGKSAKSVSYLVDTVMHKRFPYRTKQILTSVQECYFPVVNYETLGLEYFSNTDAHSLCDNGALVPVHDFRKRDVYEVIKAASSAPALADEAIILRGTRYLDGALVRPYVLGISPLCGLKKILVATTIDASPLYPFEYETIERLWGEATAHYQPEHLKPEVHALVRRKKKIYDMLSHRVHKETQSGDLLSITPRVRLRSSFDFSKESLTFDYDEGVRTVMARRRELLEFVASTDPIRNPHQSSER
jgi:predicted patatin/cPLA2 family phospholipase